MSTLTDRYVWAVVRLLPAAQRGDVEASVRSLIDERLRARGPAETGADAGDGTDREDDERAVLIELGDPALLAARYVENPRSLIGPEYFPAYVRMLKLVLGIAVPAVTALAVLSTVTDDDVSFGKVLAALFGTPFSVGVQVAFWVTVAYAFMDKFRAEEPWTLDELPSTPAHPTRSHPAPAQSAVGLRAELGVGIGFTIVAAVVLVWQHYSSPLKDGGEHVPILDPGLFGVWGWALVGIWGVSVLVQLAAAVAGRWTLPLAMTNAFVNLASLTLIGWLAFGDRLINERALEVIAERAGFDNPWTPGPWLIVAIVAAVEVWDGVDALRKAVATSPAPG